jgi:hypothetical protein
MNLTGARFPDNAYLPSPWTANVHHVHDGPRKATHWRRNCRNLETGKRTMRSELKNVAEDKLQQTSVRG